MMESDETLQSQPGSGQPAVRYKKCPACGLQASPEKTICPRDGTSLVSSLSPQLISNLSGQYEFLSKIGEGGMGVIFKARHLALNRFVAIKMIHQTKLDENQVRRFQQEAKAVSALDHQSIVRVHEFGISETGQPHMVLDFIDGFTLESVLKKTGVLELSEAVSMFDQICDAIAHAHSRGVLHRDLKPSNIMLIDRDKQKPLVKIVDFGIAKVIDPTHEQGLSLTQTGETFGSPLYMSPEQTAGAKLDERSDIYSAGCVLFEALAGAPPFVGKNAIDTMIMHTAQIAPTLKEVSLGKQFPLAVEAVVAQALAKDPNKRFQSMNEFRDALDGAVKGTRDSKAKGGLPGDSSHWSKSKVTLIAAAAIMCAALVTVMVLSNGQKGPAIDSKAKPAQTASSEKTSANAPSTTPIPSGVGNNQFDDSALLEPTLQQQLGKPVITMSPENDEAMQEFKSFPHAKDLPIDLTLESTTIKGDGLEYLKDLPLRKLTINDASSFDDKNLALIANIKSLQEISLIAANSTDTSLTLLANFPNLKVIRVENSTGVTGTTLKSLSKLKHLVSLSLGGCTAFDAKFLPHGDFPSLIVLDLGQTSVNDSDIERLQPTIVDLALDSTEVTQKGVLYALENFRDLRQIHIHHCKKITAQQVQALKAKYEMPKNIRILWSE